MKYLDEIIKLAGEGKKVLVRLKKINSVDFVLHLLSKLSDVPYDRIRSKNLDKEDLLKLCESAGKLSDLPIYVKEEKEEPIKFDVEFTI